MFTDPKGTTREKMFLPSNDDVPSRIGLSVSSMPGRHLRHHFDRKCCIKTILRNIETMALIHTNLWKCNLNVMPVESHAIRGIWGSITGRNPLNAPSVDKHSKCCGTWINVKNLIQREKSSSVKNVEKPTGRRSILFNIRKPILKRKPINAKLVGKPSPECHVTVIIRKSMRRREPMSAMYVASPSNRTQPSANLKTLTRNRSHPVQRLWSLSFASLPLWDTREHTQERNLTNVGCVRRLLPRNAIDDEGIHAGMQAYKCHLCDRAFVQKRNLTQHEKTHTGEKSYDCNRCGKAFTLKSNLHVPQKTRKCGECNKCEKSFSRKEYLDFHKKLHYELKPYKCSECGKTFADKAYLDRHQKRIPTW